MEELLACALLYQAGLFPAGPYRETLDFLFRDDPEDPLLLELEWTAKDMEASVSLLQDACARRMEGFSPDRFGRMLMEGLRVIFEEEGMDLREFGRRAYRLWQLLPGPLQKQQPFWSLSYADGPMSWGDETQSRELYRDMLAFYQRKTALSGDHLG